MHKFSNRLVNATSPYLLQHAHNPVDWFEWGEEALEKARKEDKAVLVSIGYSSCHWCHVMERESFENEDVAKLMNEKFVCIKVDREERPDIDAVYMDAVQALGVNGGWPLNVFLTPEQKPFFGGTYFSPPMWTQVLTNIHNAFRENRDKIENQAESLRLHLLTSDVARFKKPAAEQALRDDLDSIYKKLENNFDTVWGGLDKAPKFIMPSVWHWLLRYHYLTKNQAALDHVIFTLKKIGMGGIYDQIGGGFARYSVDGYWFAPHFEKMLYDNAQLMSLYAEAYAITKDEEFRTIVYDTYQWLTREMTGDHGGFYSALDADSEGIEGKFYCWTRTELNDVLGEDAAMVADFYAVTDSGNWEHGMNILMRNTVTGDFLRKYALTEEEWKTILERSKRKLLAAREPRIRPGLDDKIILSWNAMMVCGLVSCYKAFGDDTFLQAATKNIGFIETALAGHGAFYRSYKGKPSTTSAFLDDYAYLIKAYLELYQTTFEETWLHKAEKLMEFVIAGFYDKGDGYFHYSGENAEKLITSKKEIFDNVIPASNSVIAQDLYQLSVILDKPAWETLAKNMANDLGALIAGEPNYMSNWAIVWTEIRKGLAQVAMTGPQAPVHRAEFLRQFHPFAVVMGTSGDSDLPLLKDKADATDTASRFYICYDRSCRAPVESVDAAVKQVDEFIG